MNYFVVQKWQNTQSNHAGMVHLCKKIKELDPKNVKLFIVPNVRFRGKNNKILQDITYLIFAIFIFITIRKKGHKLFLMEYLLPTHNQHIIAKLLSMYKSLKVYGLAHLVPSDLSRYFIEDKTIKQWNKPLEGIITLGSSLSRYLCNRGIPQNKIHTLFHYVDLEYYKNEVPTAPPTTALTVIIMGNMKRDMDSIVNIVNNTPNTHFILCCGNKHIDIKRFKHLQNIRLYKFIPENQLLSLMKEADISLNVMYDTIGSNVITTSLAMGLAIIASDVGSIRDYCTVDNCIFCKDNKEINKALEFLSHNKDTLAQMKKASITLAKKLSIERFYTELNKL